MSSRAPYPLYAVRTLALHAQGLGASLDPGHKPGIDDVYAAIERVGWVQIDTLQVINRAAYVTLWSRLGNYDTALLDKLLYDDGNTSSDNERRLFEYWAHAACIIPLTVYPHFLPQMRQRREGKGTWHANWVANPDNQQMVKTIHAQVRENGAARPADFRTGKRAPGSWWNWDGAKIALEHLYDIGDLAIANRINFQRIYDIRERVLPAWVDREEPPKDEALRKLLEISMRAQGICTPSQVCNYLKMKSTEAKPQVEALIADGTFVKVNALLADGKPHEQLVHRDNISLLEAAADGGLRVRRTTFLNPFDSLFWARERVLAMWNFQQTIECYVPAPKRKWGYFCLPILNKRNLVGRFDPKLERKTGLLRIKALYLEAGVKPSDRLASSVAKSMRDFMRFHGATDLVIERSDPAEFGQKLMLAL
jgi:hypothetical protein